MGNARERFFAGYYRDPDPQVAVQALVETLQGNGVAEPGTLQIFSLASKLFETIAGELKIVADGNASLREPIQKILAARGSIPDPATSPIGGPGDLDFLWGAFLLTGDAGLVRRIALQLEREDRTLALLRTWFRSTPWFPWARRRKSTQIGRLGEFGFVLDAEAPLLGNVMDLDLLVWRLMAEGLQVRQELPFACSDDFIAHLATKGAACWSLQSNAQQHQRVREVYVGLPFVERLPRFVEGTI